VPTGGGYTTIPSAALKPGNGLEFTNMPSFWNPENMFVYNDVYDGSGNLVMAQNRTAKYPNLKYSSVNSITSTFWRISDTQVRLSRLTLAYTLPKEWIQFAGIQSARLNITGQNLINFYNPYPDKFMSTWSSYGSYPTLRTWTIGINLTF
jgi:hypothetical protein